MRNGLTEGITSYIMDPFLDRAHNAPSYNKSKLCVLYLKVGNRINGNSCSPLEECKQHKHPCTVQNYFLETFVTEPGPTLLLRHCCSSLVQHLPVAITVASLTHPFQWQRAKKRPGVKDRINANKTPAWLECQSCPFYQQRKVGLPPFHSFWG